MNKKDYSRRDFLRTFAALSSAPLLVSMLAGCGTSDATPGAVYGPVQAVYGPYPPGVVFVSIMVFLDAQSSWVTLSGNRNVPVHTSFVIHFSGPMNVASVAAAIAFTDANNSPVAFGTSWDQYDVNVTITPSADLAQSTDYILSVNDTAIDANNTRLTVNANSTAAFKTTA
jgi:Bacterial Ig-like domain